ncbi:MAG: dTDP-4-dehydrorhamnose 3,5-epimerase [Pseudomonadota bacterium]
MDVLPTAIPDVIRLEPRRFGDNRGYFSETWNHKRLEEVGISVEFVQDNHSFSAEAGTVRGLHYQSPPSAQAKLVRVARGAVLDVAVDVRNASATYGKWVSEELSAENGAQLWVPRGFLHGFVTLTPDVDLLYKVDGYYSPESDGAVRFDDPDLGIDWGIDPSKAVLSDKDAKAPAFRDFVTPFE